MNKLQLGSCVYRVDEVGKMRAHFVITNPYGNPPKVIAVKITDFETHKDHTVILEDGHPAIKKKSVVAYRFTLEWDVAEIEAELNNNEERTELSSHPPCSIELIKKLRKGLVLSRAVPKKLKDLLLNKKC